MAGIKSDETRLYCNRCGARLEVLIHVQSVRRHLCLSCLSECYPELYARVYEFVVTFHRLTSPPHPKSSPREQVEHIANVYKKGQE